LRPARRSGRATADFAGPSRSRAEAEALMGG
jgi:hypothetical protein